MPTRWMARVARWRRLHRIHRRVVRGRLAPDPATEYLLYQSLVGIWPLDPVDTVASDDLRERLRAYMQKAVREAKVHTSWLDPDAEFEAAVDAFVQALFAPAAQPFRDDVAALVGEIARPGLWTALARTLVHLTAPGVPDVYQGDELWNFALTDPDNRRPVDFARRRALLDARTADPDLARNLVSRAEDGRVKLHVVRTALAVRRAHPSLSGYEPLAAHGTKARHVFGFVRHAGERTVVTIVPRLLLSLGDPSAWEDTVVDGAGLGDISFTNILTGEAVGATRGTIHVADVLATFPVALLVDGR
jgi:(1->4)-alpha-D-glucan 1-alpha-D-glucosylmutase